MFHAALEPLWSTQFFTKLHLHSGKNQVHICQGDEWKTAFGITTGDYEYCVMLYELSSGPSVIQYLIYDVIIDMLGKDVITYIYYNLFYVWSSFKAQSHPVCQVLLHFLYHQLYLKGEKCKFHQQSTSFLG